MPRIFDNIDLPLLQPVKRPVPGMSREVRRLVVIFPVEI
jgi:hypothetical protein